MSEAVATVAADRGPPDPVAAPGPSPTVVALRSALAAGVCLVVSEVGGLEHANLAVVTAHMVLIKSGTTTFQRGFERLVGRGLGILAGLGVVGLARGSPIASLALEAIVLLVLFRDYFAGTLAYTSLNAALFAAVIIEIGHEQPAIVVGEAGQMLAAVAVGVVVVNLVIWLTGAERDATITVRGTPVVPGPAAALSRALLTATTVIATQLACRWLGLPGEKAIISVMMLLGAPDLQSLLHKGRLRLDGAILGAAAGFAASMLVAAAPHLAVATMLVMLGIFAAAYQARTSTADGYFGTQFGLVYALALVVPRRDLGDLVGAFQRVEGIVVALAASVIVGVLWPRGSLVDQPAVQR